jgi:hypothetical protein
MEILDSYPTLRILALQRKDPFLDSFNFQEKMHFSTLKNHP